MSFFKKPGSVITIKLFALLIPLQTIFLLFTGLIRGMKKMAVIAVAKDILMWVVKILSVLVIVLMGLPVEYTAAAFYFAFLVSTLYYYDRFKKGDLYPPVKESVSVGSARKEFFKFSLPLILSNLVQVLRKRTDVLIIAFFLPAAAVGLYYAALPFAMILTVFLFSINRIIMPVVTETISSGDTAAARELFKDFAVLSFQMTLPVFLFIFFFSEDIIRIVYGSKFEGAGELLRILMLGFFLNAVSGSYGEFFKAFNKSLLFFYISASGSAVNIGLMILLIPRWGIHGAAWATTLTLVFMVLAGLSLSSFVLKLNPFNRNYWTALALGTLFFLALFYADKILQPQLLLKFFIFLLLAGIYLFGVITFSGFFKFYDYLKKRR
ncbi:MAG: oligosaccharide flippase family protein [bacterium]|nr:oligosaccharide flippase family protein [bacterium]